VAAIQADKLAAARAAADQVTKAKAVANKAKAAADKAKAAADKAAKLSKDAAAEAEKATAEASAAEVARLKAVEDKIAADRVLATAADKAATLAEE
jgi:colicin import membrane protein